MAKSLFARVLAASGPSSRLADVREIKQELIQVSQSCETASQSSVYHCLALAMTVREAEIEGLSTGYRMARASALKEQE